MAPPEITDLLKWAPFGYLRCTSEGILIEVNPGLSHLLGRSEGDLVGENFTELFYDRASGERFVGDLVGGQELESEPSALVDSEGAPVQVLLSSKFAPSSETPPDLELIVLDVRERVTLEQELRQAQKLDAIGRLAGGMAHDFNNLLMIVQGRSELALKSLPNGDPAIRHLYAIHRTAARAESLTRQLLAFSRNQTLQLRVMSINDTVSETRELIKRWLGEDIDFRAELEPDLWPVRGDTAQIQQVLVNMVLNARDAMPKGGTLRIRTANAPGHDYGDPAREPEDSVLLAIRDSGRGMDEETLAMVFEPFFTTKKRGEGTGLGLSTAYGIITQSGGSIEVESTPEEGTSFLIHLPRTEGDVAGRADLFGSPGTRLQPIQRPGVVLLVESQHDLRLVIRSYLEDMGHHVIAAADAEAVLASMAGDEHLDLLLTEAVLPSMSGLDLAIYLRDEQPELGVIYMSSVIDHPLTEELRTAEETLLTKPFTRAELEDAVHAAMNTGSSRVADPD